MSRWAQAADDENKRRQQRVVCEDEGEGVRRMPAVGTGIWKRSSLLAADLAVVAASAEEESTHCLITEVVVPGFDWEDHVYMDKGALERLFDGVDGGARLVEEFSEFVSVSNPGPAV